MRAGVLISCAGLCLSLEFWFRIYWWIVILRSGQVDYWRSGLLFVAIPL